MLPFACRPLLVAALALGLCAVAQARPDVPAWALKVINTPTPAKVGSASAVILFEDTTEEIDSQGVATLTHRFALRVLTTEGKSLARADVNYLKGSDKIEFSRAWLMRGGNDVKPPEFTDWIDLSSDPYGALYTDHRFKAYTRSDVVSGDVFIAETRVSGPMLTADVFYAWAWTNVPVVEESFCLKTPAGFKVLPTLHGGTAPVMTTSADGREYTWTVRDQPFVRSEPNSPRWNPAQPVLFAKVEPPATASRFAAKVHGSWADVSAWIGALNAGQCDTSPALVDMSQKLTANCATPLAKIRALGAYVQHLRYVALYQGLARGYGYQARKASQVFTNGYGDCKDKANLLCAMLNAVGVKSFTAAARSGDDRAIWSDFPSVGQFDHAIAAIQVDESTALPGVVKTSQWGSLLFFDPTNEHTRVGDLPWYLQGTAVFVQTTGSDSLIELPTISPATGHASIRKAVLNLNRDGSCSGKLEWSRLGQAGAELRRDLFEASSDEALRKLAVGQLGESLRTAKLGVVVRQDPADDDHCGLTCELTKPDYVQFLKNSLAVVKSEVFDRGAIPTLSATERNRPVKVRPLMFTDEIEYVLAEGLQSEELPAPVAINSAYGSYRREFKLDGRSIKLSRHVELKQQVVPVSEYATLKKFLSDIGKADRASALLRTSG